MATAVIQRAARPTGVLPPASPFAELLRRSRFASYDPEIKQAYGAPQAYAHKGNWGLKRPISQRRKDAYITLKSYEDHAQYIEWNNAESQVRFIKRVEEMNMTPVNGTGTSWSKNLGPIQTSIWLTDSEFDPAQDEEYRYSLAPSQPKAQAPITLDSLGKKGKGTYGEGGPVTTKSPLVLQKDSPWNYRQPNFDAMSQKEFERYLEKLRELRPDFIKELRAQLEERAKRNELRSMILNSDMTDMQLAVANVVTSDHRAFINNYYEAEYARRDTEPASPDPVNDEALPRDFVKPRIKPQPHRFGGLMYSHPSTLDTYFTTAPKPAFVLQHKGGDQSAYNKTPKTYNDNSFQVSFGGMVADLDSAPTTVRPLFFKTHGPSGAVSERSIVNVRVASFAIEEVPRVVGKEGQGLNGVKIREKVVQDVPHSLKPWSNVETPGTREYSWVQPTVGQRLVGLSGGRKPKIIRSNSAFRNVASHQQTMAKLKMMIPPTGPPKPLPKP